MATALRSTTPSGRTRTSETTAPATITRGHHPHADRYTFDHALPPRGWQQWDTKDDASYFGIWVHPTKLKIFTFAEGDTTLQEFTTSDAYETELQRMSEHYGPPPPAFTTITEQQTTRHHAPRPMRTTPTEEQPQ